MVHVNRPEDGPDERSTEPALLRQPESAMRLFEWDLRASLLIGERAFLEVLVPLRHASLDAAERSTRVFGLGDVEASARFRVIERETFVLDARAGVSLPFGEIGSPFEGDGRRERILFGSGTVDPLAGLQISYALEPDRDRVLAFAWARVPLVVNSFGFRAGARATAGAAYALVRPAWGLEVAAGVYHQHRGYFAGGLHSLSAEHTDVFSSATVSFLRDTPVPLEAGLLLPLTVRVRGAHAYHTTATFSLTARLAL